jgi:hypothetical protein
VAGLSFIIPAFWTVGGDWPYGGEIDIIEGANVKGPNKMTINVRNGCTFTYARDSMAGTGEKCTTRSHTWCSVAAKNDYTAQGYYVMRRNQESMAIWYFAGNDLPGSLAKAGTAEGAGVLDETTFGKPAALFKFNSDCRTSDFGPQGIVRNIALCARYVKSNNAADRPDAMDRDCEAYMNTWDWASKARWGTPAYEVDFIEAYENA